MDRVLVTGGSGFLGAWVVRRLLAAGMAARVFDVHDRRETLRAIVGPAADAVEWVQGDIREAAQVVAALRGCGGVVHLAGVLTPDCSRQPVLGAQINLIGSLNVFEAAHAQGLDRVVYASTAGVYGPLDAATPSPHTHYGAFKLAVEGAARAFWHDRGIASIGFRPFVVYGPGRETGASAGPSLACRAAARGEPCTLGYTGSAGLVYVADVAHAFVQALHAPVTGALAINLVGAVASVDEVMAEIRSQVPGARLRAEGPPLTIAAGVDGAGQEGWFPGGRCMPLAEGLAATLDFYRNTDRTG